LTEADKRFNDEEGLSENADRLYLLSDVERRFEKAIAAYDNL